MEVDDGVALATELGHFSGGRGALASRAHRGAGVSCRFYYSGETP